DRDRSGRRGSRSTLHLRKQVELTARARASVQPPVKLVVVPDENLDVIHSPHLRAAGALSFAPGLLIADRAAAPRADDLAATAGPAIGLRLELDPQRQADTVLEVAQEQEIRHARLATLERAGDHGALVPDRSPAVGFQEALNLGGDLRLVE